MGLETNQESNIFNIQANTEYTCSTNVAIRFELPANIFQKERRFLPIYNCPGVTCHSCLCNSGKGPPIERWEIEWLTIRTIFQETYI